MLPQACESGCIQCMLNPVHGMLKAHAHDEGGTGDEAL